MLEDYAKGHSGLFSQRDQLFGAGGIAFQWFFQQDVFTCRRTALHDFQMGIGRRHDKHHVHTRIVENLRQIVTKRKIEAFGELRPTRCAAAESIGYLNPLAQVEQALSMRCYRHTKPDQGNTVFFASHGLFGLIRGKMKKLFLLSLQLA